MKIHVDTCKMIHCILCFVGIITCCDVSCTGSIWQWAVRSCSPCSSGHHLGWTASLSVLNTNPILLHTMSW